MMLQIMSYEVVLATSWEQQMSRLFDVDDIGEWRWGKMWKRGDQLSSVESKWIERNWEKALAFLDRGLQSEDWVKIFNVKKVKL